MAWWWGVGQLLKCQAQAIKSQPQVTVPNIFGIWYSLKGHLFLPFNTLNFIISQCAKKNGFILLKASLRGNSTSRNTLHSPRSTNVKEWLVTGDLGLGLELDF